MNCATTNAFFANDRRSFLGWSPNPLGLGGKPAPFKCKRRNELRDYKRVFANDRRSFLGWSPNPLGLGGKPAPFKCKRRNELRDYKRVFANDRQSFRNDKTLYTYRSDRVEEMGLRNGVL